jgi:integrase
MARYRLSDKAVQAAKPGKGKAKIKLSDGGGLTLIARATDKKFWTLRVTVAGRTHEVGLGAAAGTYSVGLAEARDRAFDIHKLLKAGTPLGEAVATATKRTPRIEGGKATSAGGLSFREVAERYMRRMEKSWKSPVHTAQWYFTMEKYVYPTIGHKPPGDVTRADVIAILEPIWSTMPETATRVRGRIETIIAAWMVEADVERVNPATWRGKLDKLFPKKSKLRKVVHHKALPYAEVPKLMTRLAKSDAISFLALRFLILTATRTTETLGAKWPEIDFALARWTIPEERMKTGVEHVVPLSDAALLVLGEAKLQRVDGNAAIFPGTSWQSDGFSRMSNMSLLMVLRQLKQPRKDAQGKVIDEWVLKQHATVHGFRSSFRDWAADAGHNDEAAEKCLAHAVGSKVRRSYQRSDMLELRTILMSAWADYVVPPAAASGKVVALPKRGR